MFFVVRRTRREVRGMRLNSSLRHEILKILIWIERVLRTLLLFLKVVRREMHEPFYRENIN
jgi:hypothetical protein